ncbi:MAG TPA: hypothetical protein V6D07_04135 [Trichocoleus sp.]
MKRPKFFKIVFTDYLCCILFFVAIACAIFFVLKLTIPVAAICGLLLYRRVCMIRDVFSKGVSATALITQKKCVKGEWLLRYVYSYDNTTYERANCVVTDWVRLGKGDRTEVFVNPKKPTQAFLTAFYLG